jgi:integrase
MEGINTHIEMYGTGADPNIITLGPKVGGHPGWEPYPNKTSMEFELNHGTLHGLRHAFATSLLTANIHPAIVQQALGHSSINLTIDTYSHVMPGIEEAAARKIDEVIGSEVRKIS